MQAVAGQRPSSSLSVVPHAPHHLGQLQLLPVPQLPLLQLHAVQRPSLLPQRLSPELVLQAGTKTLQLVRRLPNKDDHAID